MTCYNVVVAFSRPSLFCTIVILCPIVACFNFSISPFDVCLCISLMSHARFLRSSRPAHELQSSNHRIDRKSAGFQESARNSRNSSLRTTARSVTNLTPAIIVFRCHATIRENGPKSMGRLRSTMPSAVSRQVNHSVAFRSAPVSQRLRYYVIVRQIRPSKWVDHGS